MRKLRFHLILLFLLAIPSLLSAQQAHINIIPAPVKCIENPGNFIFDRNMSVHFQITNRDLAAAVNFFNNSLNRVTGFSLPVNKVSKKLINLHLGSFKEIGDEGYFLTVTPVSISIKANTRKGIVYGLQSLLQLLPAIRTNADLKIPCMEVTDYPRFAWRGMHLDVCRHFFGPEFVKEYIDLIASYKLNTFHWHLTDDQGWRIEIKKYPLLTQTGAWRVDETNEIWGTRPQAIPGKPATYGGYYTQEQIKDIIQYAADRNVTIVPEIEMPGHAAAAIASYPFLSCSQQPQLPMTGGNYTNISSNFCAGNDSSFTFLENVLSEVIQLFPSAYIHIGGDEVDKSAWKACTKCQARMKAAGLQNEEQLQSYFIGRIEKFVNSKGRKIIGWDEILEGGLAPNAAVMSWRGEAGGVQAASLKHEVVMTPGTPCYFDHYQAGPEGEPLAFGGFNTLQMVYEYEPIPSNLDTASQRYILGAQGNLWTEYITTPLQIEYMLLPRMPALAEVVWTPKKKRNWADFNSRLPYHYNRFEQRGTQYCHGNFTVKITPVSKNGKLTATLSNEIINSDIYYTTNGTFPGIQSAKYTGPIPIDSTTTIRAITVMNGRAIGQVAASQEFAFHKAIGKKVNYTYPVSSYYLADGPNSLTDGIRGKFNIHKYWLGFNGEDLIATLDLGSIDTLRSISLGCLQKYTDWIFLPQWVKFEISSDGNSYTEIKSITNPISINQPELIYDFMATFHPESARYIRITAKNNMCPPGHSGAGKPGWIFADEIIVR